MKKTFYMENLTDDSKLDKIELDIINKVKNASARINREKATIMVDTFNSDQSDIELIKDIIKENDENIVLKEKENVQLYRKVLILEGLDCANCSAKIERIAKRSLNHELISVDFATERFIIETEDKDLADNIVKVVQSITSTVDANILVTTKTKRFKDEEMVRI